MTTDWRGYIPWPDRKPDYVITFPRPISADEYALLAAHLMQFDHGAVPNRLHGAFIKEDGDAA